ncbi:aromatic amino acid transaminase [Croceibacterium sp. LX-88]|uniref:Aromatic amino acid transaminase n=1 Tax=Croceibacterium selenioxidans TaxID=2838833 RepID=A0ABS5W773_9SPHN|nr:aromatic amino acid transaminase [Croceibacterium selenioxidans]MBT2135075.1 aromatic amino acid transaminase [Croceibacterium selenioxidans]
MLDRLTQQPPDALLALIKLYDADPRADKIDLGVGVYRTGQGDTPVFGAIKAAEAKLVAEQDSKAYLGPEGDMGFVHALMPYIFSDDPTRGGRIDGMQTPGGTGAVRLAAALAQRAGIARVFMGTPSWPNHAQILADLGLELVTFQHANADGSADLEALKAALSGAGEGDAVLLHGCCHNPTGIDYTPAQWDEIAAMLGNSDVLPIIDLAYQGLGEGLEEDAYGARAVIAAVPEALIAYSCDKNFGLYRDRVGALYVFAKDGEELGRVLSNGHALARAAWSMPPDHGAAAVRLVLEDKATTAQWLDELDQMRTRIRQVREALGQAGTAGALDLTPYARQQGMFAMLPLSKEQIQALREDHAVYMAGSGRINVAGLTLGNLPKFIAALAAVTA